MSKVLMIFVDGIGIGEADIINNPFFTHSFKTFTGHFGALPSLENAAMERDGKYLFPVDALLGVEGTPQSGTGQTTIFCGFNAAAFIGKHFGPFPFSTTIPLIQEQNIFKVLSSKGKKVFFANAYPKVFFDYLKSGKTRVSTTSLSYRSAGYKLNTVNDVRRANALTAEITGERWNRKLGYKIPVITPESAARRLVRIALKNDFTLYEYFLTDYIGHGRIADEFLAIFRMIDNFLFEVIAALPTDMTLLVVSDHGNLEDISKKQHTLNPSLAITAGKHALQLKENIKSLIDVRDAVDEVVMK